MESLKARVENMDNESQVTIDALEKREAGVAELTALYERIEAVYFDACHVSEEYPAVVVTNSANLVR